MLKKFTLILVLIFISAGVFAADDKGLKLDGASETYNIIHDKKSTHEKGKVKMTIFFDFFCPHCHQFDSVVVPLLLREYGDKLKVTFTGYPIIYEDSVIPVEAYELAKAEGKGEEMKTAIFDAIYYQRKDGANHDVLISIAKTIGMNGEKFQKNLESGVMKKTVLEGRELAKSYGANSTPTVILDGNILVKDNSLANVSSIISRILEGKIK
ncbi:MAG: DsbA family protein [Nitrospirae bacterium]|nr:DsbA family protein [Nitrospirota bacterium]